jgi:hypothetical protein
LHDFCTTFINPTDSEIKTSIQEGWFEVGRLRFMMEKLSMNIQLSISFKMNTDNLVFLNTRLKIQQLTGNFTTFNEWIASADIPVS